MEKKKSQKTKSRPSRGRKQLSSVRVIQRNLVYIIWLPLNLADEDLLLRREYFGQYGKVLKVSMSRTAAGVIQQFPNNTCSVYITYSKEEEAIRCIQSVHGFILEGRPLRACFGTTKYCHAWLRNVPCTNPDCLYLHEIGSQEDSFTKDEVISAYTRVQQITGAANNQLRRSGNILPPPLDDYNSNCSTGKPIIKNASSNMASARGSPPNGSSGRPNGLPPAASWASRASNSHPQSTALTCSNELLKPAPDTASSGPALSSGVATTAHESNLPGDASENPTLSGENHLIQSKDKTDMLKSKQYIHINPCSSASEKPSTFNGAPPTAATSNQLLSPASRESDRGNSLPSDALNTQEPSAKSSGSDPVEDSVCSDGNMQNLWSDFSSLNIKQNGGSEYSGSVRLDSSLSEDGVTNSSQNKGKQTSNINCSRESPTLQSARKFSPTMNGLYSPSNQLDSGAYSQSELQNICPEVEEDVLAFNNQRLKDPEVVSRSPYIPNSSYFLSGSNHSRSHSFQRGEGFGAVNTNVDPLFVNNNISDGSSIHTFLGSLISDGVSENLVQSSSVADSAMDHSLAFHNLEREKHIGMHQGNKTISNISVASDSGESSIISNILSLDLDPFDEPLTSPNNLAKLLGETDRQPGSLSRIPSSRKVQNNSQSRFSFARHEESEGPAFNAEPHYSVFGEMSRAPSLSLNSSQARDMFVDRLGVANGFSSHSFTECNNLGSNHPTVSSMKHSASRAPISAPPGFAVPSRAPPGFTAQERVEQTYDMTSGNHMLDVSSLSRNSYQAPTGSVGNTSDLEFYDPAILTVVEHRQQNGPNNSGLDVRSNYPSQFNFENEARLQLLMQRSLPQHQNLRYSDIKDNYSLVNDSYGITPRFLDQSQVNLPGSYGISTRLLDQTQVNNMSPFGQLPIQQSRNSLMSNGQWNGVQGGNSLSIAELLRNERLGFDKFYTGYEDTKFRMHTSGDLYNRTFGL